MNLTEDGPYEYDYYLLLVNRLQTLHNHTIVELYRVKKQYEKHEYLKNIILINIESLFNIIIIIYLCFVHLNWGRSNSSQVKTLLLGTWIIYRRKGILPLFFKIMSFQEYTWSDIEFLPTCL
jgi:hypothetical protein